MDLQDRFAEWLLAVIDRLMDGITFGAWERVRGEVVRNVKVRK